MSWRGPFKTRQKRGSPQEKSRLRCDSLRTWLLGSCTGIRYNGGSSKLRGRELQLGSRESLGSLPPAVHPLGANDRVTFVSLFTPRGRVFGTLHDVPSYLPFSPGSEAKCNQPSSLVSLDLATPLFVQRREHIPHLLQAIRL